MKKKDAKKFAARVNDVIENELVACGICREYVKKYLHLKKTKLLLLTTCKDLIELENFMHRNNRIK